MNSKPGMEKCLTFINCQLQTPTTPLNVPTTPRRAVTISRQTGSGGHAVAERLADYLQQQAPNDTCPWTVFDRNLVEKVLEDHHLPKRLAQFMPEDRVTAMSDTMDELFGLHPPTPILVRQISETILNLAKLGNVIIIGRGAHIITRKLDYVLHVRLVGSVEKRTGHLQAVNKLSRKEALELIEREDGGRRRYLKKYFGADIDDPLLYHLVINTDLISYDQAALIIGDAMLKPAKQNLVEA